MSGTGRMAAWRAHAYEGLRALRLEQTRVPPLRAPDELLVRVRAASLNPLDVAMLAGYGSVALHAQRRLLAAPERAPPPLPLVCGRDFCGVVEARGAAVSARLGRGVRVWGALPPHVTRGAHAQYVRVKDAWVTPAPERLGDAECAGAPYAALTACALVRAAGLERGCEGARVLLLGLGGVGQAALQLLATRGAHVTVGAGAELHALALELGARSALDRHAEEYGARLERGGPYAAVLDCAGLGGEEAGARRWRFARYVTLTTPLLRETDARGVCAGAAAAGARLAAQWRAAGEAATGERCPPPVRWALFEARRSDLEALRGLAERGRFKVRVWRAWDWRRGGEAYEAMARGSARGKLVLDFTAEAPPDIPESSIEA